MLCSRRTQQNPTSNITRSSSGFTVPASWMTDAEQPLWDQVKHELHICRRQHHLTCGLAGGNEMTADQSTDIGNQLVTALTPCHRCHLYAHLTGSMNHLANHLTQVQIAVAVMHLLPDLRGLIRLAYVLISICASIVTSECSVRLNDRMHKMLTHPAQHGTHHSMPTSMIHTVCCTSAGSPKRS